MKSERRHELQHNELADWMVVAAEKSKPYANVVLGGVVVLAILVVVWVWMVRESGAKNTQAWEDFYAALSNQSFAELNNVVEHYPGSDAAEWAQVVLADRHLAEGCDELFTSRAGANQELDKARENYESVLSKSSNPTIRQRAQFGLARAWESQGQLDKAIEFYKKVVDPEGPYSEVAEARIAMLGRPATRSFYDEFAQYDPKPAYREGPIGPLDLDNLDNLDMPGPGENLLPGGDDARKPAEPSGKSVEKPGEAGQTPPATTPAAGATPPATPPTGDAAPPVSPATEPATPPASSPAVPATPPADSKDDSKEE